MKKFTIRFIGALIPLYVLVLFYIFYISPNLSGDLGNIGQIPFGKDYSNAIGKNYLLRSRVIQFTDKNMNSRYKIGTIGDSFSQQGINGYQNYLANLENTDILNFKWEINCGAPQTAINLLNSGVFSNSHFKVVIIECVERQLIYRLSTVNFGNKSFKDSSVNEHKQIDKENYKPFLENVFSWIRLSCGYNNPVNKVQLDANYFDSPTYGNKLFFYEYDLSFKTIDKNDITIAKSNLTKIVRLFESKGIKLIFMIAADKYDVYQSFIIHNPYPKNRTLDYFKDFEAYPYFVNSKQILYPLVRNGVKDVYLMNDSHWSYKASQVVAKELKKRIYILSNTK